MKKIGLFYATKAERTSWVAEKIQKEFDKEKIETVPIEQAWQNDFAAYDCFIVGASTWFDGELPTYWDELLPELRTMKLKGKKVAIFGLGDQIRYPENFADGIGLLAEVFEEDEATLVGFTSSEGYTFERSKALRGEQWCGLVVDLDNQSEQAEKSSHNNFVSPYKIPSLFVLHPSGLLSFINKLHLCPAILLFIMNESQSVLFRFFADGGNIVYVKSTHIEFGIRMHAGNILLHIIQ